MTVALTSQAGCNASGSQGRHDPRAPVLGSEELERAVQKLALGLESIERQSGSGAMPDAGRSSRMSAEAERRDPRNRDTVTTAWIGLRLGSSN
jgi:hypothetical protein